MPIEPPEIPPATPGQPTEPPQESPPGVLARKSRPHYANPVNHHNRRNCRARCRRSYRYADPTAPAPQSRHRSGCRMNASPERAMNNDACNPLRK